ncbi:MAG TPA: zinc metallopeptidase [Bacillota bacterium]|nr:zinc metallopeptidase [Bacillota bacterium]HQB81639.1 zinc metallopeptidase [Bacillota bacterium]
MSITGYLPFLISIALSLMAQAWVSLNFWRYNRVASSTGHTGFSAARRLLDQNGLQEIAVEQVTGRLSDHFSPREKKIRLSEATYKTASIAAIGVAAHETGHAIQHRDGYQPNRIRSALLVPASIGSMAGPYIVGLGFAILSEIMVQVGVALFAAAVLFYLITLPVEINASHRALILLAETGILAPHEIKGARRVLAAAALTYVASALTSVLYFFRVSALAGSRKRS